MSCHTVLTPLQLWLQQVSDVTTRPCQQGKMSTGHMLFWRAPFALSCMQQPLPYADLRPRPCCCRLPPVLCHRLHTAQHLCQVPVRYEQTLGHVRLHLPRASPACSLQNDSLSLRGLLVRWHYATTEQYDQCIEESAGALMARGVQS